MKRWVLVVVLLALLAVPGVVMAGPGGAETGHFSSEWDYVQTYNGWGPACYYGEPVRVEYHATNSWTYVLWRGDVRETLVQNGTAKVYDLANNLLDEFTFHVTERFFDAGADVAIRHEWGSTVWYQASGGLWTHPDLEEYYYIWKIPGRYDFRARNRGGSWSCGWTSGDCEDGWPDGWPPRPPHPFNK